MTRTAFLAALEQLLAPLPEAERKDALSYYEDYLDAAGPENEARAIAELGSPEEVARKILDEQTPAGSFAAPVPPARKPHSRWRMVLGGGLAVLVLELAKGFFPVWAAGRNLSRNDWVFGLVMAAPVIGHAFPFWNVHKGGKAIAVSFGVLLGLAPDWRALGILVCCYLFFSLVVVVTPNLYRSVLTYGCVSFLSAFLIPQRSLVLGVFLLSGVVVLRHFMQYRKEEVSVHVGLHHKKQDGGY